MGVGVGGVWVCVGVIVSLLDQETEVSVWVQLIT